MSHKLLVTGVLLAVTPCTAITPAVTAATKKLFGPIVLTVFNRVMGLIVLAIAVGFILDGIVAHFPSIATVH